MKDYHLKKDDDGVKQSMVIATEGVWEFTYTFENFFHPFVGELIAQLNKESLAGLLNATFHEGLRNDTDQNPGIDSGGADDFFFTNFGYERLQVVDSHVQVKGFPKEIDVSTGGPYANYNWELLFHIPLMIAVHLSKNQRFAEAQRWFHYIFDPTSNDQSVGPKERFWKFLAFRHPDNGKRIEDIVAILSVPRPELSPDDQKVWDDVWDGYTTILNRPFQPHPVARSGGRQLAYQYCVVMKYLDNLIAWGDHLFQQDTVESINEATQLYVLAANILGQRPQRIPPRGRVKAKTFAQLKQDGLGPIGNAFVDLESQFPFNSASMNSGAGDGAKDSSALFGIGRTLSFCIPPNEKLLSYWDTVADRLFKIRHCMNIAGIVRPLALFDPPIDPGMLVKAAAAGIDIGSIVSGLNQPVGPVRSLLLIQKALELAGEVRGLGASLLSALEKGDGERLALLRQGHEIKIQQMVQEVRFLQWKQAQETTTSLLTSRKAALEQLHYYQRLLGLPADQNAPDTITLDRRELAEDNFDGAYGLLVEQYDKMLRLQTLPRLRIAGGTSPAQQSGASGSGQLYLNTNEDAKLNKHGPAGRTLHNLATVNDTISAILSLIPDVGLDFQYWGLGSHMVVFGGSLLAAQGRFVSSNLNFGAAIEEGQGTSAGETAVYERRADEWLLQHNRTAHDLMLNGRQILTSLVGEQVARREYLNIQKHIEQSQDVDRFLREKFTNEELYLWMQGEISRLYYEYYRFAFDTARKAEQTMKRELMRPEVDAQDFVKFNYWDGGRKGLLSGEALYLDLKRMEIAYHENNKREFELIKHVSLRQLNPLALLTLKAMGTCEVTVPEWLFDMDCPGHYMRRIKNVSLSIPSVAGPYTSVSCTLSLLKSSLRKSPIGDDYVRQGSEDERFVDYYGAIQSIVTSSGNNDSGMFETNLRDERFLPFEGAGAISTWKLDLPKSYRAFDYNTISDVILHIRYTARPGVDTEKVNAALDGLFQHANQSNLALVFSLRHDFPSEWHRFVNGSDPFKATIKRDHFPYFTKGNEITIDAVQLHAIQDGEIQPGTPQGLFLTELTQALKDEEAFVLTLAPDAVLVRDKDALVFVLIKYSMEQA